MKTSFLIKGLQDMVATHGDLPIELCICRINDKGIQVSEEIFLRHEHYIKDENNKNEDVISISDFPY